MFIVTTRFSRKKAALIVILLGCIIAALILFAGQSDQKEFPFLPELADNEQRIAYLQTLGWTVDPEPLETLQFVLPNPLGEPYLSYNELQLEQGFDLIPYAGKQISRYTYAVTNYPGQPTGVQANLYICENLPVAGDLCFLGSDGFQEALVRPELP